MEKLETINKIKKFLDGYNEDLKHLVNIEADPNTNYVECFIHNPNGVKLKKSMRYQSFIYMKDLSKHGIELYPNERKELLPQKKIQYGIEIKKLRTDNQKRLSDGYCYMVTSTKSYNSILDFFKDGGVDIFKKKVDEEGNIIKVNDMPIFLYKDLFYMVKPVEQFLISTGSRFYKGIEEYKNVHKVVFDIETTGLRYHSTRIFAIGIWDNRGYEKVLEVKKMDDDNSEIDLIKSFFNEIINLNPAIICGYNSEDFDFDFILGRLEKLEVDIRKELKTTLDDQKSIFKTFGSLKYGSTTEKYRATKIYGMSVIDILHSVKKTSAINSEIKNNKLKYICQYEGIAKPNRVYINGEDSGISEMYRENKIYLTNKNYEYVDIPNEYQDISKKLYKIQVHQSLKNITKDEAKNLRVKVLKGNKDFIEWFKTNEDKKYFISGKKILRRYLKDDLWETAQVDELYNQSSFMLAKMVPTTYERVCTMGTAAIWELLLTSWSYENGLAIPHADTKEDFPGGLARCFKIGFSENIIKIDYSSLYPMIQLTHNIFPNFDITGVMKSILTYSTTTRNIYKKIGGSGLLDNEETELLKNIDPELYYKYKSDGVTKEEKNTSKVKQLPIKILNNSLFGALGSDVSFKWSDNKLAGRITCTGRIELRRAIKWFGDYGCTPLLAVTDGVNFQIPKKTNIKLNNKDVFVLDEYDLPENMWLYGDHKGINALIEKFNDEEMIKPYMSIDDDGSAYSALNLSRINYATLFKEKNEKGEVIDKIKLTGNTIKSKTMPEYIEDFLNVGLKLLLNGKGSEFVDYYYDYVDDIFYKRIPLKKIASKSKIKNKISTYLKRGKDKNGREKGMQAHMELIIVERTDTARKIFINKGKDIIENVEEYNNNKKHTFDDLIKYANQDEEFLETLTDRKKKSFDKEIFNVVSDYMPPEPDLDTTIYYYNNGYRKSHGDVKMIKDKDTGKTRMASQLIKTKDLIENPDMLGDYNIDKYLEAFNSRIEKFLIGFNEEVREKIPAKIKRSKTKNKAGVSVEHEELLKNSFTSEELELKNFDQDLVEEALYLEDKEIKYWNKYGYNPYDIWDGFKVNEGSLKYDEYLEVLKYLNTKMDEINEKQIKRLDDPLNDGDFVLLKEGVHYHLGLHNDNITKVIKYNIKTPKTKNQVEDEKKEEQIQKELDKLKIEEIRDTSKDKYYFELFKEKYNIPKDMDNLPMEEFFMVIKEAEKPFRDFINEMENNELEEYGVDID